VRTESGVGERVESRDLARRTELSLDGGELLLLLLLLVESGRRRAERTEGMLSAHKAGVTGHLLLLLLLLLLVLVGWGRVGLLRERLEARGELARNGKVGALLLLVVEGRRNRDALVVGLLGHLLLVELERQTTAQLGRRLTLLGKVESSVGVTRERGGRLARHHVERGEASRRFDGRCCRRGVVEGRRE